MSTKKTAHRRPGPPPRAPRPEQGLQRLIADAAASRLVSSTPTPPSPARQTGATGVEPEAGPAPRSHGRLAAVAAGCAALDELEPQSVAVAYSFATRADGSPYDATLRIVGRLVEADPAAESGALERFDVTHVVRNIEPGVGEATVTLRTPEIRPGRWRIRVLDGAHDAVQEIEARSGYGRVLAEAGPGVSLGAWPAAVAVGAVAGIALLGVFAQRAGLPAPSVVALALVASLVGLVGAKLYYLVQASTGRVGLLSSAGMCIQGFVLASLATLSLGAAVLRLPVLTLADLAIPGLLLGMAIGRLGCFYGGCCTGRLSSRRWALRSSDRFMLARRLPVQLLEGAVSLALALATLGNLLTRGTHPAGVLAVAAIGSYVVARQLLFGLRSTPRRTRVGRPAVGVLCGAAAAASLVLLVAH